MGKLCMIMQHITLCIPYIAFTLVSYTCIFVIGHAEQGPEEIPEPAQVEGVN
jgi:ABC-type glycerol-3-phosphate transport system permease component